MKTVFYSLRLFFNVLGNMGWRYVVFRFWYEFQLRTGLLKWRFPAKTRAKFFVSVEHWRKSPVKFFFGSEHWQVEKNDTLHALKERVSRIRQNQFQFFGGHWYTSKDWHTNIKNGFVYNQNKHWTEIPDFSAEQGDIKYVWEKTRFTFLYDLIRYDFHFKEDQSEFVFSMISDWIEQNPVNRGPNWKCGQEISLRVLNWTFALNYYRHSECLTQEIFDQITGSIYDQMLHVEENINFSRIAVRNNHALTETLGLYSIGLLFPFFPESISWREKGKKWLEKEIEHQIDADGTYLQFSMNYHRIVVQLLTWAIVLAHENGDSWKDAVYEKARKSLWFLRTCQDDTTGWLPNYGNNDGALFFPLTECHFRDFRPQLTALSRLLKMDLVYGEGMWNEESEWFGIENNPDSQFKPDVLSSFQKGGYYIIRDHQTATFLRCGTYQSGRRPHQADNLHLDIWVNGENILRDAGSYSYSDEKWAARFAGTSSHNTVTLGSFDQMQKQSRFIWFNWVTKASGVLRKEGDLFIIELQFEGFKHLGRRIMHRRRITKKSGQLYWVIEDWLENAPEELTMNQLWHPSENFTKHYKMESRDENGTLLTLNIENGWYSETYGQKVKCEKWIYSTNGRYIKTILSTI
jgi:hypothetical protein